MSIGQVTKVVFGTITNKYICRDNIYGTMKKIGRYNNYTVVWFQLRKRPCSISTRAMKLTTLLRTPRFVNQIRKSLFPEFYLNPVKPYLTPIVLSACRHTSSKTLALTFTILYLHCFQCFPVSFLSSTKFFNNRRK